MLCSTLRLLQSPSDSFFRFSTFIAEVKEPRFRFTFMESVASSSSLPCAFQEASNYDELLMQQGLAFADGLMDLRDLRKQLYSAAEYFEGSYKKDRHKQKVLDTLKDYALKSLVHTVDHLGFLSCQVTDFLDDKIGDVSSMELQLSCIEQRLRTCQESVDHGGLSEQSLAIKFPKYHKHYILPVGKTRQPFGCTTSKYHSDGFLADSDALQFKNAAEGKTVENPSSSIRELSAVPSPQSLSKSRTFSFMGITPNKELDDRATSPHLFSLKRSGSLVRGSFFPNSSKIKRQYPSEGWRSVSLHSHAVRERSKDIEPHPSKNKRLLKALLSMHK